MGLERSAMARPPRGQGRVVALFSYRYDAHLVPDLIANITPAVHGWIAWDDRGADQVLSSEPARRRALLQAAREAGADWILSVDPDERFEIGLAERMGEMTRCRILPTLWTFSLCEMFTPDAFRVDGVWGGKQQMRLFPASVGGVSDDALHQGFVSIDPGLMFQNSMLRLYHLRMAAARRRQLRRDTYAALDPERRNQRIGYDYLADDRGMVLEPIEAGRNFHPAFVEDDGIWGPEPERLPPAQPDPPAARLHYVALARRKRGAAAALHVVADLAEQTQREIDLSLLGLYAQLALEAGRAVEVERVTSSILGAPDAAKTDIAVLSLLRGRARLASGDSTGATEDLARLRSGLPQCRYAARLMQMAQGSLAPCHPKAPWRRWAGPKAQIFEGKQVAQATLAVVVIGVGAPPELKDAVASVLEQDTLAEVVVVNTGGGSARAVLAPYLDRIRLICCPERRFVGAARNIGIDASRARYVAFLASDCRALPGWVKGRVARHMAGASAVGNPVASERPDTLISLAYRMLMYNRRHPRTPPDLALRFGLSYDRALFTELGYFSPALRVGEDSAFNALLRQRRFVDWAPDVITTHRDPTGLVEFLWDQVRRGSRRAAHPPFATLIGEPRLLPSIVRLARQRHRTAVTAGRRYEPQARVRQVGVEMLIRLGVIADTLGVTIGVLRMKRATRYVRRAETLAEFDLVAAQRAYRAALALNDQDWKVHLGLARAIREETGPASLARATRLCRRAAALAPHLHLPILELCDQLVASGQSRKALAVVDEAIAGAPGTPGLWIRAADLSLACGDPKGAMFYAQGAFVLAPSDCNTHRRLVRAHKILGNSDLARRHAHWIEVIESYRAASRERYADTYI